ncbi:hypothetical protein D5S18_07365 [Nocardia panacis]|uniref:Uncharacterized protein n=1 Tax=Nocardia panacis TaxID=2340916 RepID=A0A3A4KS29_9NOCA|nr:hypothetical protein [Nocardia panacis]RJO77560.1 hypothetical protein D5S18_07365 [Nocardia panacis]
MTTDETDRDAAYSWEVRYGSRVVEYGVQRWGEPHPWTGATTRLAFEIAGELFEQACLYAMEESRDTAIDAEAKGRAAPEPIGQVIVVLRDPTGAELANLTAHLRHRPITRTEVEDYRALMQAWAEDERRMAARAAAPPPEPAEPEILAPPHEFEQNPAPAAYDPRHRVVDDLLQQAVELRESVVDPDHCRRRAYQAERRLVEDQDAERLIAAGRDEAARAIAAERVARSAQLVSLWQGRMADSTEIYLRAAALDTEAARLSRALDGPD